MLLVKINGIDITAKVDYNTIKITEQMNNRANTCSFSVTDYMVQEGALIEVWEGSELSQDELSSTATIHVDETYEYFQKYRVGDSLKIPAGSPTAITKIIQSISHTNKTITFTTTLGVGFSRSTQIGRLIFAGVILKNPDDEIGKTGILSYKVQAVDYTKIFDAKNVVDTFEDMYSREIIGRSVYRYTATDLSIDLDDLESIAGITTGTAGGTATVKALVVAGGGGGGGANAGGGGAGGLLYDAALSITAGAYSVTVGNGGTAGTATSSTNGVVGGNGGNSIFHTLTSIGGGGGSTYDSNTLINPGNGGSGGGGRVNDAGNGGQTGGTGTAGQGYAGGNGLTGSPFMGAGGGGAGGVGADGNTGTGGVGVSNSISGSAVFYAGGGGGGGNTGAGVGGNGGGGNGKNGTTGGSAGTANTGGGGGGGGSTGAAGSPGFAGGSGIVIVSYATDGSDLVSPTSTGGTVTTSGGYTIHTFTTSGIFTMVPFSSSVAITPVLDTTDKIYKNNSVKIGASGAGDAIYTVSFSAKNVTGTDSLRAWIKMPTDVTNWVSGIRFRMISTDGNYYEWNDTLLIPGGWSYDSFAYNRATVTGTPNLASITSVKITLFATQAIPIGTFKIDHLFCTKGGFTIRNTERGSVIFSDVRSQYKKPTVLLEDLAKLQKLYWYIDYERDIHFFEQESYSCPMEITDTSEVYGNLSITADISQLKNRQVVRGGESIDASLYTQDEVTDGKLESWRLDYKPKALQIWVDTTGTGSSYVQKTVGIENLDDAALFDYLYNFNEKIVKRASAPILASGTLFRRVYYPYKPIRVQVEDAASIVAMKALLGGDGIFDGALITDLSIRSFQDARERAKAEIAPYKNPVITGTWQSDQDGWKAGQIVHIQDSNRGIDSSFVIQKVSRSQNTNGRWSYQVQAGSTMFGLIEFFQLLMRRSEKLLIDVSEIVDVVKTIDETIILTEVYRTYKKGPPWYVNNATLDFSINTVGTEGGTANDAYADYCEAS